MSSTALQVEEDGTVILVPDQIQDPEGLDAALSVFADRTSPSRTSPCYHVCATSVWRARRTGLSLETMIETLETHSGRELPDKLRSDLTLWDQQISRLSLESDQGRLVLHSSNPLVITAVMRHRTLSGFVAEQLGSNRVALRAETYPELIDIFDSCRYPMLDHLPSGWTPQEMPLAPATRRFPTPPRTAARRVTPSVQRSRAREQRPAGPFQCQATTKSGRQCKNRARSNTPYCRVHASRAGSRSSIDPPTFPSLSLSSYLEASDDGESLNHVQLARSRTGMLMGVGLGTWLCYHLLVAGLQYGFGWAPATWLISGVAFGLSCGVLGRLVAGMGLFKSLGFVVLNLLSIGFDCLHKEGLIVNLCFVVIPVLLPLWGLSHIGFSWAWVFLCFPVGLGVGQLGYSFLDAMSS